MEHESSMTPPSHSIEEGRGEEETAPSPAPPPQANSDLSTCAALIFDACAARVLVRRAPAPQLPSVQIAPAFYPEVSELLDKLRQLADLDCAVLRCLDSGDLDTGEPRIYSAVARAAAEPSAAFRWLPIADIRRLDCPTDRFRRAVERECDRMSRRASSTWTSAWQWDPSWRENVRSWIADNLPPRFDGAAWDLVQIRSWAISAVFRIQFARERLYFKAAPSYFPSEVAVTRHVASRFPDVSPRVTSADPERGWMLMEDMGDLTLAASPDARLWRESMSALADVGLYYADRSDDLRSLGLDTRSTSRTLQTLESWISAPDEIGLHFWSDRAAAALRRLEPSMGRLSRMSRTLDDLALPPTLDHGDLDGGNIFVRSGKPVLMDWSDASISSPLFTPAMIPQVARSPDLADAFLERWTSFATLQDLREGFSIARTFAALERAAHYRANIVRWLYPPSVERRGLERYVPELLELVARELDRA